MSLPLGGQNVDQLLLFASKLLSVQEMPYPREPASPSRAHDGSSRLSKNGNSEGSRCERAATALPERRARSEPPSRKERLRLIVHQYIDRVDAVRGAEWEIEKRQRGDDDDEDPGPLPVLEQPDASDQSG